MNLPGGSLLDPIRLLMLHVPSDGTLEERTRATMRMARELTWYRGMIPPEHIMFETAIGAMMAAVDPGSPERDQLVDSMLMVARQAQTMGILATHPPEAEVRRLAAQMETEFPNPDAILPLQMWWSDSADRRRGGERRRNGEPEQRAGGDRRRRNPQPAPSVHTPRRVGPRPPVAS